MAWIYPDARYYYDWWDTPGVVDVSNQLVPRQRASAAA